MEVNNNNNNNNCSVSNDTLDTNVKFRCLSLNQQSKDPNLMEAEEGLLSNKKIIVNNCKNADAWQIHNIDVFENCLSSNISDLGKVSKQARKFYKRQDEHINELVEIFSLLTKQEHEDDSSDLLDQKSTVTQSKCNNILIISVFVCNVMLLFAKAVASIYSGSLAIIFSLLDSLVDLFSGGLMWYAGRQMRKRRPYTYPQGRTRFEPISIIILSVFMSSVSIQLIIESIQTIVLMSRNEQQAPSVDILTLSLMCSVIVTKIGLWIVCMYFGSGPSVHALVTDQRNDILSNIAALTFGALAGTLPKYLQDEKYENFKYFDPVGAILIGMYILYSWYGIGAEQTRNLAGHTADQYFIQKIAFVCLNYHPLIEKIDTIRAFHFGSQFLVEVDIVLPRSMYLKEAHDIGEGLQKQLERLQSIERAFVHLDYEYTHHPESEHKIV